MAISERLVDALNAEIGLEFFAHSQYLAMAHYFESMSLDGMSEFFYEQAEEEKEHGLKIVHYLGEINAPMRVPAIDAPKSNFQSPLEVAEVFLAQEQHVTDQFNSMTAMALEDGDYATFNFLQWFVNEQVEEIATASKMIDLVKLVGSNLIMLNMVAHSIEEE
ncbi:MAG: ferritin [Chloroflexota bacterium]